MAIPHSLHEISIDIFEDIMHVHENWREMHELVANIRKSMQDQSMQEKIGGHMQNLLHESTLAATIRYGGCTRGSTRGKYTRFF